MTKIIRLSALAGVAAMVAACGIRSSLEDDLDVSTAAVPVDAGPLDSSPQADAGPRVDTGAADAAPDVALPVANLGDIVLTSGRYSSGAVQTLKAEAQFVPSLADTGCSIALADSSGSCTIEVCGWNSYPLASAGAIQVTGGSYALALAQKEGGAYAPLLDGDASDAGPASLWLGGESLTVTASGGVVPPFVGHVVAPSEIMVQTPGPTRLLRQGAFAISWVGASIGDVVVEIDQPANGHAGYYLECHFPVSAGVGVVSSEALGRLAAGGATMTVSTENRASLTAGPWLVKTFARTHASDLEGNEYLEAVTLE
jgi:hypothetical protein